MEYTKTSLRKAIHNISNYTYSEIDKLYYEVTNREKYRNKYYARKAGCKKLSAVLIKLRNSKKF